MMMKQIPGDSRQKPQCVNEYDILVLLGQHIETEALFSVLYTVA